MAMIRSVSRSIRLSVSITGSKGTPSFRRPRRVFGPAWASPESMKASTGTSFGWDQTGTATSRTAPAAGWKT